MNTGLPAPAPGGHFIYERLAASGRRPRRVPYLNSPISRSGLRDPALLEHKRVEERAERAELVAAGERSEDVGDEADLLADRLDPRLHVLVQLLKVWSRIPPDGFAARRSMTGGPSLPRG
jgi:hypothetical protein